MGAPQVRLRFCASFAMNRFVAPGPASCISQVHGWPDPTSLDNSDVARGSRPDRPGNNGGDKSHSPQTFERWTHKLPPLSAIMTRC